MTTIHTPHPTSYAIPHPAKRTSIRKRAALAAIGAIGAAAALGGAVSAYSGSVPTPAVAVVAPDTVTNPPAVSAPNTIQPVTAPGSTVITTISCPAPIPPTKPGHKPVAYITMPSGKPCGYPNPQQGGGGLSGGVEGPGGGGVSSNPTLGGGDPDPLPPNDGGGGGGLNSCTNLDKTCHATQ